MLDQHNEKTPKDPTIGARSNTYCFADREERVADLLAPGLDRDDGNRRGDARRDALNPKSF